MKLLTAAAAAVVLLAVAGCAVADNYIDLPVKWSQLTWESYLGYSDCDFDVVFADDFLCEDPDPIVAVRWWGIYAGVGGDEPEWDGPWHISFHYAVGDPQYSEPGDLIVLYDLDLVHQFCVGFIGSEGVYQHEAYLPWPFDQWTHSQDSPNQGELFMDICKPHGDEEPDFWHWCTVGDPHPRGPDYAVYGRSHVGPWYSTESDMAFELMVPEPGTLASFALALSSFGIGLRIWRKK